MKEKNIIPGPAKAMYGTYFGFLVLTLYTGFYFLHPFISGWRYPWSMALMREFNWFLTWGLALVAFVFLYYQTIGHRAEWKEPLAIYRICICVLTIWFWFLTYAVYRPFGWLHGLVSWFGGTAATFQIYEAFLWIMLLVSLIYIYARWAKSARYPHLFAAKAE